MPSNGSDVRPTTVTIKACPACGSGAWHAQGCPWTAAQLAEKGEVNMNAATHPDAARTYVAVDALLTDEVIDAALVAKIAPNTTPWAGEREDVERALRGAIAAALPGEERTDA